MLNSDSTEFENQKSYNTDGSGIFQILEECNITSSTASIVIETADKLLQAVNEARKNDDNSVVPSHEQRSAVGIFIDFLKIVFPPPEGEMSIIVLKISIIILSFVYSHLLSWI